MKVSNDDFRQYLDEVEKLIEDEKSKFKLAKIILKKRFTFDDINSTLTEKRRAFDYAFTTCTMRYSLGGGNIRENLDHIWDINNKEIDLWTKKNYNMLTPTLTIGVESYLIFAHFKKNGHHI